MSQVCRPKQLARGIALALLAAALLSGCSAGPPAARDAYFTLTLEALTTDRDGGLFALASATYIGPEGALVAYGAPAPIDIELVDDQGRSAWRRTLTGAGRQGAMAPGDRLVWTDSFPRFADEPAPPPGNYELVCTLDYTLVSEERSARLTLRAPVALP